MRENKQPKYSGACLPVLRTCRTLRREAIYILGHWFQIDVYNVSLPHMKQSPPIRLWDHLRGLTYIAAAPPLHHLRALKQVIGLEHVVWKPFEEPLGLGYGDLELPDTVKSTNVQWSSK